eukprot:EG_transcript_1217
MDTVFTRMAFKGPKCAANETIPGDPSLPTYSSLRSCDPGFRWLAQWISQNLATAKKGVTLENNGRVWDIFLSPTRASLYVIGTLLSEINGPIDASNAQATSQLNTVRTQSLSQVASSGDATLAYLAAVGQRNVLATQSMEALFLAQLESLDNTSRAALTVSQQSSSEQVQQLTLKQAAQVDILKDKHLNAMSTTAGWTIAVVLAILLGVMACSAWGTIRITFTLTSIISLMEDVAEMRVEDLEVPQNSGVEEVARIQTAFRVLVLRLAEYKSYIPAGLFEREELREEPTPANEEEVVNLQECSDQGDVSDRGSSRRLGDALDHDSRKPVAHHVPSLIEVAGIRTLSVASITTSRKSLKPPPSPGRKYAKKNVAVLSVNVMGFIECLRSNNETITRNLFNDYVALVHEAASQERGNVDCVLGDQVFVTFNAHIPCSDSAGAAMAAASEVRTKLLQKVGDKLKFQVGVSLGQVLASSVGYVKFKSMVTVGSPMKLASILSHMPRFGSGTILIDSAMEEKVKFAHMLIPVELMHIPDLKSLTHATKKSHVLFAVEKKKVIDEDEWMYQIRNNAGENGIADWMETFNQLVRATSVQELQSPLQQFLAGYPTHEAALRLQERLTLWVPGLGVPR